MTPTASTAAWALHDLGLATSLGGSVFGRVALHPAVGSVSNPKERGELIHNAWKRFDILNLISHGVFAATWFAGRATLSGRSVGRKAKGLVWAKDALIVTSVLSGITSMATGLKGIREPKTEEAPPMTSEGMVAPEAGAKPRMAQRITDAAGVVNVASLAGIVGVTAALAMKASKSGRWGVVSRLLP